MLLIRAASRFLALASPWAAIAFISTFAALAAPSGEEVYTKRCSACHDQANPRIPPRDSLKKIPSSRILKVLDFGAMMQIAYQMTREEREAVAKFLGTEGGEASLPPGAYCKDRTVSINDKSKFIWNGWSPKGDNARFQPADVAGLTIDQVRKLRLKWAFGYEGDVNAFALPAFFDGQIFVGSARGTIHALRAESGCVQWTYDANGPVRSAMIVVPNGTKHSLLFGDQIGWYYALEAETGKLIWKKRIEDHDTARLTGAALVHDGVVYVPVARCDAELPRDRDRSVPRSGRRRDSTNAHQAGDKNEVSHRWPQILPGGQTVLFTSSTVSGAYDDGSIQVLSLKTGQWKVVQRGGYFGRYLATSNRAGELVYVHQGTLLGVPFDLDRLEVRGTPAPLLEDVAGDPFFAGGQFDVSRNGTFVYLGGKSSAATWPLVWLDSTGKTEPLLVSPGSYYSPRLSPDGKRLAVSVSTNTIGVYDSQRDTMTPLTFKPQTSLFPVWMPDGKHIVFAAAAGTGTTLQWIRSDGAGEPQPLLESKTDLRPYSFSPDGKRLAFGESRPEGESDIWTLPLDLSDPEHPKAAKPQLFLRTMADEYEPALSPDGRWIAYRSNATGFPEIYVQPFPGPGGKWLISTGGGRHPVWSRNGRELFYQAQDFRIMVATYSAKGDSFAADKPRRWAETQILEPNGLYWNLDLAPDGKRFVVSPRPEASGGPKGSVHVTVLLNFFDELRRRMPTGK